MSRLPRYKVTGITPVAHQCDGPAFSWYRMDEGPIYNRIGHLCLFLLKLGLTSPNKVFTNEVPNPKWFKKGKKRP